MRYPTELKDDKYTEALARLQSSAYSKEDQPYLFTERYSLSSDFEKADVDAKGIVNTVGAADNLYSLRKWQEGL
jgi:hypothetical protein